MAIDEQEVVHPLGLVVPLGVDVAGSIVTNGPTVLVHGKAQFLFEKPETDDTAE